MKGSNTGFTISMPLPISNPDLLEHAEAENEFLNSYKSGRLPHAWLICGPRGIGKATLAYRISRFLLSRREPTHTDNNLFGTKLSQIETTSLATNITEPACRRVVSGGHPDFKNLECSFNERGVLSNFILVDQIRDLGRFLSKKPAEGGWRIVVIDSADDMNNSAANATLKILEEPPKKAILLLVSHNPQRLLPTIRSRCRHLRLTALSNETVAILLHKHLPQMTTKEVNELSEISEGSIGRALELSELGGLEIYNEISDILNTLPHVDIARVHQFADKVNRDASGKKFEISFHLINRWLTNIIKRNAISKDSGLDPWIEVWDNTAHLIDKTKRVNLERKQVILNTFIAIRRAANH